MARHLIPSDTTIRTIKPGDPRKRVSDGAGLVLLLFVNGSGEHGWRFDYRCRRGTNTPQFHRLNIPQFDL